MNGKGSTRRPSQVSAKQLATNWERTFRRKHTTSDDAPADSTPLERYMYGTRWTDKQIAEMNRAFSRGTIAAHNRIVASRGRPAT